MDTVKSKIDTVKSTFAENVTGSHKLASKDDRFSLDAVPDQSGKVAVVTGGSEGIGYGCVHTLIRKNISKTFILSPSKEVAESALKDLKENFGDDKASRVTWKQCDLTDWKAVADLAFEIRKETDRLDVLINNAARGIMSAQRTEYGVDRHMALNHMAHVILTSHLLPLLKKTASEHNTKVRIVNLASNAHQQAPPDTKFANLEELNKDYGPMPQYGRAKLTGILYAKYLARHLTSQHPNILANATHPGFVETKMSSKDIHEPWPIAGYAMSVGMVPLKKDLFEGAVSTMFAATAAEQSGQYICPPAIVESGNDLANNEELEENLMKLTREVIEEKTKGHSSEKGCPFKDF
ncbi:retinol dehydrogenase 12 [Rhizodiscina lignyota]|uniref:Retinol dehydrogenase 12 n=1 Tax=Rhizodiscina lignyota TaxID=1504668 RepID=A0A9P4ICT0_9PEZI|nr:retinol dehydrogenase 12 [Rhizodiscina lignyota]